jgi:RNA polymerase subunit RPABC4/transcription elongation factor Spt4
MNTYPCHTCGYMVDYIRQWCPMCLAFRIPPTTDTSADEDE